MTHANDSYAHLEGPLLTLFREQFAGLDIISIEIPNEADLWDEDRRYLEINVLIKGTPSDLVRSLPSGFSQTLIDCLTGLHQYAFPVVNYIDAPIEVRS